MTEVKGSTKLAVRAGVLAAVVAGVAAGVGTWSRSGVTGAPAIIGARAPVVTGNAWLSPADRQLQVKLQTFIGCMNGVDRAVTTMRSEYDRELVFARDSLAGKPPMIPPNVLGVSFDLGRSRAAADQAEKCAAGLEQSATQPPALPVLDGPGADYARALRAYTPIAAEAAPYYQQKDWKDDRLARGRAIDARLRPVLDDLGRASAQLRTAVHDQEQGLRVRELAATDAHEGHSANWHGLNVMVHARAVADEVGREAGTGGFDPAALLASTDPFATSIDDARAYATAHPDAPAALRQRPVWARIDTASDRMLLAAKELRRTAQGPRPSAQTLTNAYDRVVTAFNQLVDAYNAPY